MTTEERFERIESILGRIAGNRVQLDSRLALLADLHLKNQQKIDNVAAKAEPTSS